MRIPMKSTPKVLKTTPNVYIIESLYPDDEGNGRLEGVFLAQMLRLHGKETKYSYVRTRKEFKDAIRMFKASGYRYLHISAHGDKDGIDTTNRQGISYSSLAKLLDGIPPNCRLFMSSCEVVHADSAKSLVSDGKFRSLLGPVDQIHFHDSAATWAAIYHLIFKANGKSMNDLLMVPTLNSIMQLFDANFAFYKRTKDAEPQDLLEKKSS
jgi:hypothetical protein